MRGGRCESFGRATPRMRMRYHPSRSGIATWRKVTYATPQDVKAELRTASILKGGRVVFNIAGNKYRLILAIDYERQIGWVRFVGTHAQYDKVDAESV